MAASVADAANVISNLGSAGLEYINALMPLLRWRVCQRVSSLDWLHWTGSSSTASPSARDWCSTDREVVGSVTVSAVGNARRAVHLRMFGRGDDARAQPKSGAANADSAATVPSCALRRGVLGDRGVGDLLEAEVHPCSRPGDGQDGNVLLAVEDRGGYAAEVGGHLFARERDSVTCDALEFLVCQSALLGHLDAGVEIGVAEPLIRVGQEAFAGGRREERTPDVECGENRIGCVDSMMLMFTTDSPIRTQSVTVSSKRPCRDSMLSRATRST